VRRLAAAQYDSPWRCAVLPPTLVTALYGRCWYPGMNPGATALRLPWTVLPGVGDELSV